MGPKKSHVNNKARDRAAEKQALRDKDSLAISSGQRSAQELREGNGSFAYALKNPKIAFNRAKKLA